MLRRIGLPIAIIVVGFGLAAALLRTGPSITPQAPVAKSPLVRAVTVQPADFEFGSLNFLQKSQKINIWTQIVIFRPPLTT